MGENLAIFFLSAQRLARGKEGVAAKLGQKEVSAIEGAGRLEDRDGVLRLVAGQIDLGLNVGSPEEVYQSAFRVLRLHRLEAGECALGIAGVGETEQIPGV